MLMATYLWRPKSEKVKEVSVEHRRAAFSHLKLNPQVVHIFQEHVSSHFERDWLILHSSYEVFQNLQKRGFLTWSTESVWNMPWCISTITHPSDHGPGETRAFDISSSCVQTPPYAQWFPRQQQLSGHLKTSGAFSSFQGIVPRCWQTYFHGN